MRLTTWMAVYTLNFWSMLKCGGVGNLPERGIVSSDIFSFLQVLVRHDKYFLITASNF